MAQMIEGDGSWAVRSVTHVPTETWNAVVELIELVQDTDEIRDRVKRHRRDPAYVGNNDWVNEKLEAIADAVDRVGESMP